MTTQFGDSLTGLVNKLTGTGTDRDKITAQEWFFTEPLPIQLRNSYRASWVCRKTVDAPVNDMLREGWTWQADEADAEKIMTAEKALKVKAKIAWAKRMANLYGGAAILIGDGSPDPMQQLDLERIGRGGLRYLTTFTRHEVMSGDMNYNMLDPFYGEPKYYMLSNGMQTVNVHPSRVVRFVGREPAIIGMPIDDQWGDSILAGVLREIGAYAVGIASTSRLLEESTVNYYRMKGYLDRIATEGGEDVIMKALNLLNRAKSSINAIVVDSEDGGLDQFRADFAGLPEIVRMLLQVVSGAADIPLTRLLGTGATGLNATGESDTRNYYDRLKSEQEQDLSPALDRIGQAVVRSALGTYPEGMEFKFNPLWQLTEKEQSEVDSQNAATLSSLGAGGHVPGDVMAKITRSVITESPTFSGAAAAYDEADKAGSFDKVAEGETEPTDKEVAAANQIGDQAVADGTPRSLYVSRRVTNAADIVAWAKGQGFKTTVPAAEMHVTIAYSREKVDWHAAGEAWEEKIEIAEGGPRTVERFGSAVVLEIAASSLRWRHEALARTGATWEHDQYRPHITITWDAGALDLDQVEPYRGRINLGPEIFEQVREDWRNAITEDGR